MKEWIKYYDLMSPKTSLFFKGYKRYTSVIGFFMSVIYVSIMIGIGLYFFIVFVRGEQMSLITSKDSKEKEISLDLTDKVYIYNLADTQGNPVDSRMIQVVPTLWTVTSNGVVPEILAPSFCPKDHPKKDLLTVDITKYYCLYKEDQKNINIVHRKVPYKESYLNIYVVKCMNTTENNNHCLPSDEIDQYLREKNLYIVLYSESVSTDNFSKNPIYSSVSSQQIPVDPDSVYVYNYIMRKIIYESDHGFIVSNKKHFEDVGIASQPSLVRFYQKGKQFFIKDTLLVIQLSIDSTYVEKYQRTYQKLQTLAANTGGINSVVFFICEAIATVLTRGVNVMMITDATIPKSGGKSASNLRLRKILMPQKENNFLQSQSTLMNQVKSEQLSKFTLRQKGSYNFLELMIYFFCRSRKRWKGIRECEDNLIRLLDIRNLITLAKDLEFRNFSPSFARHPTDISGMDLLKKYQKKKVIEKAINETECTAEKLKKTKEFSKS